MRFERWSAIELTKTLTAPAASLHSDTGGRAQNHRNLRRALRFSAHHHRRAGDHMNYSCLCGFWRTKPLAFNCLLACYTR